MSPGFWYQSKSSVLTLVTQMLLPQRAVGWSRDHVVLHKDKQSRPSVVQAGSVWGQTGYPSPGSDLNVLGAPLHQTTSSSPSNWE